MRIGAPNPAISQLPQAPQPGQGSVDSAEDFGKMLKDALAEVNETQMDARSLQNDFMTGKPVEFHDLMIRMEQASTAMALTMQVRNKLLEAYQEISRTQI
jgi:flagellar hook-basal body complex protein FliE